MMRSDSPELVRRYAELGSEIQYTRLSLRSLSLERRVLASQGGNACQVVEWLSEETAHLNRLLREREQLLDCCIGKVRTTYVPA